MTIVRISSLVVAAAALVIASIATQSPELISMDSPFRGELPTSASAPLCIPFALAAIAISLVVAAKPSTVGAYVLVALSLTLALLGFAYESPVAWLIGPLKVCTGHMDQYCAELGVPSGGTFVASFFVLVFAAIITAVASYELRSRKPPVQPPGVLPTARALK